MPPTPRRPRRRQRRGTALRSLCRAAAAAVLVAATPGAPRQENTDASGLGHAHISDSWDFCNSFACPRYLVNDVTSSACLFGCRTAAVGTLLSDQDCRLYCVGIQDQPQVLRYTGKLSEVERKFWRSVCEDGCKHAVQQYHQHK